MPVSKETKERIDAEAHRFYPDGKVNLNISPFGKNDLQEQKRNAYTNGAEIEAERSALLIKGLKNIRSKCYVREVNDPGQLLFDIMAAVDETINQYNSPKIKE